MAEIRVSTVREDVLTTYDNKIQVSTVREDVLTTYDNNIQVSAVRLDVLYLDVPALGRSFAVIVA